MTDLTPDLQVYLSWGSIVKSFPLCQLLPCRLGPPRPTFHQSICYRLPWLHPWSIPCVHTSGAFSPSWWGPDPQCQAVQVVHWTWWWQCLAVWHCRPVWSLPCHSAADVGGLALLMAKSYWHGALYSTHKSYTHGHVSWKRGGGKTELVAAPWTSSRQFSHVLWLKVHSRRLLRACLLDSKRKLPLPACQVLLRLPSMVHRPRSVKFPGTVYISNQGPLSSAWAHCIFCTSSACSHCRRCCCCPLVRQTVHGDSPEHCKRSRRIPQIMIFVFPAFTLSPFSSIASFQIKSLLTHTVIDAIHADKSCVMEYQGPVVQS